MSISSLIVPSSKMIFFPSIFNIIELINLIFPFSIHCYKSSAFLKFATFFSFPADIISLGQLSSSKRNLIIISVADGPEPYNRILLSFISLWNLDL